MERSLGFYRERLEAFHRELAEGVPLQALFARFPEWSRLEAWDWVQDFRSRPGEGGQSARGERWQRFVAEQVVRARSAAAEVEIDRLERRSVLEAGDERLALFELERQLPLEPLRPRRAVLARALDDFALQHASTYARRWDGYARAAEELGEASGFVGETPSDLITDAEQLLAKSEDAYRDLLGYVLHKIDARVGPLPGGSGARHDLIHAAAVVPAPLSPEALLAGVQKWLEEIGWWRWIGSRIRWQLEDVEGRSPKPCVRVRRSPEEIHIFLRLRPGWDVATTMLRLCGQALGWASLRPHSDAEDRWLPNRAALEAWGALCAQLLTDENWLRRYFQLPPASAREVARLLAFHQLVRLRGASAMLPVELNLRRRGPSTERVDELEAAQRGALWVAWPRGAFWREASFGQEVADALHGEALAASLRTPLLERFNDDFWRNPATRAFLENEFGTALLEGPAAFAAQSGGPKPTLAWVGERLVRVMAA